MNLNPSLTLEIEVLQSSVSSSSANQEWRKKRFRNPHFIFLEKQICIAHHILPKLQNFYSTHIQNNTFSLKYAIITFNKPQETNIIFFEKKKKQNSGKSPRVLLW